MSYSSALSKSSSVMLIAVLVIGIWWIVIKPAHDWHTSNMEKIRSLTTDLVRVKRAVEENGEAVTAAKRIDHEPFVADFLNGNRPAGAMALWQAQLQKLITANNAKLMSVRSLPEIRIDEIEYVGLQLKLVGEYKEVRRIIHQFENRKPIMFIERAMLKLNGHTSALARRHSKLMADISVYAPFRHKPKP